jgi:hypothetical protein
MTTRIATFALALVLLSAPAFAGSSGITEGEQQIALFEMVLRDGSRLFGTIERETADEIVFRTQSGATVTARRGDIESLKPVVGTLSGGEFMPPDPNATRLFFAPTGRSLAKGETYLGVYEFLMPFVQVGVTNRFSMGAGTPLLFGFDEGDRPFWITPKLQIARTSSTAVAIGVFHVFDGQGGGGGVAYAVSTSGNARDSFTVGGGVAYNDHKALSGVVMVGGERQVRRHLKVITENYGWRGTGLVSGGMRFFGERLSADLALAAPLGADDLYLFPVVNFVYRF